MVSEKVTVVNEQGLHMRPAGALAGEMGKFDSEVTIKKDGRSVNAKSVMDLMAACIKCGTELQIECSGSDENEALQKAVEMIKSGFGE